MANKHIVTDKNGKIHKRISANRTYAFAVVRHWDAYDYESQGAQCHIPAGSAASWCSRLDLAESLKRQMIKNYWKTSDVEIIPVTPSK